MHRLLVSVRRLRDAIDWLENPVEWFEAHSWQELLLLLAAAAALLVLSFLYMPKLERGRDRLGIVALQLAWTPTRAKRIVDAWREDGLLGKARSNVYVDFLFLVFYAASGILLVILLARAAADTDAVSTATAEDLAAYGARAIVVAAALDAVENIGLLRLLKAEGASRLAVAVSVAASAKFLLATVTIGVSVAFASALAIDALTP